MPIRRTRLALRELDEVRRSTLKTWGRTQWLKYYRGLVRAFDAIMTNPDA